VKRPATVRPVTIELVETAIQALSNNSETGKEPTFAEIQAITGGSMSTLTKHMTAIREKRRLASLSHTEMSQDFQMAFHTTVGRAIEEQTRAAMQEIQILQQTNVELCQTIDELKNELGAEKDMLGKAKVAIALLKERLTHLKSLYDEKAEAMHQKNVELNNFNQKLLKSISVATNKAD